MHRKRPQGGNDPLPVGFWIDISHVAVRCCGKEKSLALYLRGTIYLLAHSRRDYHIPAPVYDRHWRIK